MVPSDLGRSPGWPSAQSNYLGKVRCRLLNATVNTAAWRPHFGKRNHRIDLKFIVHPARYLLNHTHCSRVVKSCQSIHGVATQRKRQIRFLYELLQLFPQASCGRLG